MNKEYTVQAAGDSPFIGAICFSNFGCFTIKPVINAINMQVNDDNRTGDQEQLLSKNSSDEEEDAKNGSRSDGHSTFFNSTPNNGQQSRSPYRHQQNQAWVSLSVLVDERRSDGRLITDFDEDEPHTPFEATNRSAVAAESITHNLKRQLYLLMEDPSSSSTAFWVNVVVSVLIVFSAIMTTVETIPAFRSAESNKVW